MLLDGWRWPQPCDAKIGCAEWDCCIDAINVARERRGRRRLKLDNADAGRVVKLQCGTEARSASVEKRGSAMMCDLARVVETHEAPHTPACLQHDWGHFWGRATITRL